MVWGWLHSRISARVEDHNGEVSSSLNQLPPTIDTTTTTRQMSSGEFRCESLEVTAPIGATLPATTATTDMQFVEYEVQGGDCLYDISRRHNVDLGLSVQELQKYNNLKDDVIIEGDVLAISMGPVNKAPLDLRHGWRRTNRILFSRQPVLNRDGSGAGGPEIREKVLPVISSANLEGKWNHKKKGFPQHGNMWLHFSSPLTDAILTSPFGWRWGALHEGVDLAAEQGTPILASDKGTVTFCGWSDGYGYLLAIQHEGGFVTRYAHCCAIHTQIRQQVQKGQHVASVGATGRATGPHLHFEVRRNGEALDPLQWVNL